MRLEARLEIVCLGELGGRACACDLALLSFELGSGEE